MAAKENKFEISLLSPTIVPKKRDSSYVLWVGLHRRLMSGPALKLIVRPNNNKKEIFLSPENGHPTHKLDHWKG